MLGQYPKPLHHGLTPFGEEVVREMQRIGMLVDVSHVSPETVAAVLRVAKAPIIASHSSARALCDSPRNLDDDELRAIAKNGGVVMVNFFSAYLDPKWAPAYTAFKSKRDKEIAAIDARHPSAQERRDAIAALPKPELPEVPLSVLIDHIEHIAKVAGVDHVGLGSDWDGAAAYPIGLAGMDGFGAAITRALLERGFSDDDVRKILGGNFLRVFAEAIAFAKRDEHHPQRRRQHEEARVILTTCLGESAHSSARQRSRWPMSRQEIRRGRETTRTARADTV